MKQWATNKENYNSFQVRYVCLLFLLQGLDLLCLSAYFGIFFSSNFLLLAAFPMYIDNGFKCIWFLFRGLPTYCTTLSLYQGLEPVQVTAKLLSQLYSRPRVEFLDKSIISYFFKSMLQWLPVTFSQVLWNITIAKFLCSCHSLLLLCGSFQFITV